MTLGWKILIVILAVLGAFGAGVTTGIDHEETRRDLLDAKREIVIQNKIIEHATRVRDAQQKLQGERDEQRRRDATRIAAIAGERDAAVASLRNRPERPSGANVPQSAGPRPAVFCTGAQLYRDDAEFLVRRAHVDDVIRAERDSCYASYERAKAALKKFNDSAR